MPVFIEVYMRSRRKKFVEFLHEIRKQFEKGIVERCIHAFPLFLYAEVVKHHQRIVVLSRHYFSGGEFGLFFHFVDESGIAVERLYDVLVLNLVGFLQFVVQLRERLRGLFQHVRIFHEIPVHFGKASVPASDLAEQYNGDYQRHQYCGTECREQGPLSVYPHIAAVFYDRQDGADFHHSQTGVVEFSVIQCLMYVFRCTRDIFLPVHTFRKHFC